MIDYPNIAHHFEVVLLVDNEPVGITDDVAACRIVASRMATERSVLARQAAAEHDVLAAIASGQVA